MDGELPVEHANLVARMGRPDTLANPTVVPTILSSYKKSAQLQRTQKRKWVQCVQVALPSERPTRPLRPVDIPQATVNPRHPEP